MEKRHFKKCKTCTDYKNQFYDCDLCKYAKGRNDKKVKNKSGIFTDEDFEKELAQDADRENAIEMITEINEGS